MFRGKESIFVTVICAAGMGAFVAFCLLDFAVVRSNACKYETTGVCLREWVSALSGWAAAIGALIAAGLTIAKLREQIADQKRQTDFIIGDSLPIIEWTQDYDHFTIIIKNFNRHSVQLITLENCSSFDIGVWLYRVNPKDLLQSMPWNDRVPVGTKIDVRKIMRIIMQGYEGAGADIPKIEIRIVPLEIQLMDEARKEFTLNLSMQIHDIVQRTHTLIVDGNCSAE